MLLPLFNISFQVNNLLKRASAPPHEAWSKHHCDVSKGVGSKTQLLVFITDTLAAQHLLPHSTPELWCKPSPTPLVSMCLSLIAVWVGKEVSSFQCCWVLCTFLLHLTGVRQRKKACAVADVVVSRDWREGQNLSAIGSCSDAVQILTPPVEKPTPQPESGPWSASLMWAHQLHWVNASSDWESYPPGGFLA